MRRLALFAAVLSVTSTALIGVAAPPGADAASGCQGLGSPVYEQIRPEDGGAFLSASSTRPRLEYGFTTDHGALFEAATKKSATAGAIYRLGKGGDYLYTSSKSEAKRAQKIGYGAPVTAFYAPYTASSACLIPVRRYLLGGRHRYAASTAAQDALLARGAVYEQVAFYAAPLATDPGPVDPTNTRFTLAVYPDTQQEVLRGDDTRFGERASYLLNHRGANDLDIRFLTTTGDNVNWDTPGHEQYARLDAGLRPLDGQLPFSLSIGNHDSQATAVGGSAAPGDVHAHQRDTHVINQYVPVSRETAVRGVFETGKIDNAWSTFNAAGHQWLVLNLELWPRASVVTWAAQVVASHPDYNVIVATHSYLNANGSIYTVNGGYGDTAPTYLWDQVIRRYPNIKIVLSGHVGTTATRVDTGDHGNKIVSYLTAIHSNTTNPIRFLEIDASGHAVRDWVYGPRGGTNFTRSATRSGLTWAD